MPVHENLSAAMPACHAERSEASKLPPDQNTAKPPNTPSNSYAREGKPPSHSPATPHDSGAIIWPGRKSSSQEAGGHSLPVYGEGLAEELPNSLTPAQLLFPRTRGNAPLLLPPHAGERKGSVTPSGIHRRNRACASRHGWERKGAVTPSGIHQPATSATPQQLGSPRAQILSRRLGREGGILMALVRSRQASSSLSHVKRSKA